MNRVRRGVGRSARGAIDQVDTMLIRDSTAITDIGGQDFKFVGRAGEIRADNPRPAPRLVLNHAGHYKNVLCDDSLFYSIVFCDADERR